MISFHKITKKNLWKIVELTAGEEGKKHISLNSHILLEAIFDNRLPSFDDIKIKRIHGALGQVSYVEYKTKDSHYTLEMLPRYITKRQFLETLVHEMIHLFQMRIRNNSGNHNKLFYSFRSKLRFLGLGLSR